MSTTKPRLDFEQRQRAEVLAESRDIDLDTAFELVLLLSENARLAKELAEAHERLAQHQQQIDHELEQRKQENAARRRFRQLKKETKSYYGDDSP